MNGSLWLRCVVSLRWGSCRVHAMPVECALSRMVADGAQFLYVGMAYAHRDETNTKASGVFGRLKSHASGRRSGDQFCIYICDRFVIPTLTKEELEALASGDRFLDRRTRDFIHQNLTYRTVLTAGGSQARELELYVRQSGLLGFGRPAINP